MKPAKIFIAFTFLLAFALQVSAQTQPPKIVWKNLQEKYERFEDIAPVLVNESNKTAYFNSSYVETARLLRFDEKENKWIPNPVMICGNRSKDELAEYYSKEFTLNFNEEKRIIFDELIWKIFIYGDGSGKGFKSKTSEFINGKFKFRIDYWFDISKKYKGLAVSESPEFIVMEKEF